MPSVTTNAAWNSDSIYALGLCRTLTQFFGIWPLDCQNVYPKIRFIILLISQVIMAVNLLREIRADCVEDHQLVNFVGLIAVTMIVAVKVSVLRINRHRMKLVITSALEDWIDVDDTKSYEIMRTHASLGRSVFIFQMCYMYMGIALTVLTSLRPPAPSDEDDRLYNESIANSSSVDSSSAGPFILPSGRTRGLPVGTGCFVDGMPPSVYVLVYVVQLVQLMTTATGDIGNDAYFFCISMHVCAQFELLKIRIEDFPSSDEVPKYREELGRLVRRHNHLMTLATNVEKTYSPIILGQLTANSLHMGLYGLQILMYMKTGNGLKAAEATVAVQVLSLQLFLYSYTGDYLSSQSKKIRDAVYNCRWYDLPPIIVRDLIFIITYSRKKFRLTAGKMYEMNIRNFKDILKAMFSYFSVLRLMFIDKSS